MRHRGMASFFAAVFFGVLVSVLFPVTSASAQTVPVTALSQSPVLTEQSGTWSTTIYLNVATVCSISFSLVTSVPDEEVTGNPRPAPHCSGQPAASTTGNGATGNAVTRVVLTFGSLPGVPQAATLIITPPGAVAPLDVTLTVHRQVTTWQYVWVPLICGFALGVLLLLFTRLFVAPWRTREPRGTPAGKARRPGFLRTPLYAAAAWTFSDSWATNITAIATVVTAGLAATTGVAEVLPGVDLGRFSLLIAMAGGITVVAPLVFGALNSWFQAVDPTTTWVAQVWLPTGTVAVLRGGLRRKLLGRLSGGYASGGDPVVLTGEREAGARIARLGSREQVYPLPAGTGGGQRATDPRRIRKALLIGAGPDGGRGVRVRVPAGASVTVYGGVKAADGTELNSGTSLDVPSGAIICVAPPENSRPGWHNVLTLPGTTDIVVAAGQRIRISAAITLAASDVVSPPERGPARRLCARLAGRGKRGKTAPAAPPSLAAGDWLTVPEGAKISFLGRATVTLPAGACIQAPVAEPGRPPTRSVVRYERGWSLPPAGETVAADMWSMLAAAFVTVFGIGAEIGIVGWSLGFSLAAAPLRVRVASLVVSALAGVLVLGYGVAQIRALADPREGSALSGAGGSSFTL
jgi:hypothetical protein